MGKAVWVKTGGVWKKINNVWVKTGGVWKQKVIPKGKISSTWKDFISYDLAVFWEYTPPVYMYGLTPGEDGNIYLGNSFGSSGQRYVTIVNGNGSLIKNLDVNINYIIEVFDFVFSEKKKIAVVANNGISTRIDCDDTAKEEGTIYTGIGKCNAIREHGTNNIYVIANDFVMKYDLTASKEIWIYQNEESQYAPVICKNNGCIWIAYGYEESYYKVITLNDSGAWRSGILLFHSKINHIVSGNSEFVYFCLGNNQIQKAHYETNNLIVDWTYTHTSEIVKLAISTSENIYGIDDSGNIIKLDSNGVFQSSFSLGTVYSVEDMDFLGDALYVLFHKSSAFADQRLVKLTNFD